MFLGQRFAVEQILPIAEKRLRDGADDNSELYEGQLRDAVKYVRERP